MAPHRSFVLFVVVGASMAVSQTQHALFDRVTTADGPSRGTIYSILQDTQGFLWLGTATGLLRYDGYTFKRYTHNPFDSTSLSGDFIWSVCEDSSGDLWIGTSGRGLNRYVRSEERFIRYTHVPGDSTSLLGDEVAWVYVDRANTVWAGSWNSGLNKLDRRSGTFKGYTSADGLPSKNIHRIYEDRHGRFWVGTRRGLALFDRETGASRIYKPDTNTMRSIPDEYIFAIYETKDGSLWIGTDRNLCRYNSSSDDFTRFTIPSINNPIPALCEDADGNLWIATDGNGIFHLNVSTGEHEGYVLKSTGQDTEVIMSLYRDRTATMWVGTVGAGLWQLDVSKGRFRHVLTDIKTVNAFHEDDAGTIWIGTQGGVRYLPKGTSDVRMVGTKFPEPLRKGIIYAICEDRENLWFGTWGNGLYRMSKQSGGFHSYSYPHPNPIGASDVTSLFVDSKDAVWVGQSAGGISRYDAVRDTFYQFSSRTTPFPSDYVWAIHEDKRGYIWAGTWDQGVIRFDPRSVDSIVFSKKNVRANGRAVSGNTVVSIAESPDGILWFGTWGDGLNRYDPIADTITHYSSSNGLPNNHIYGILIDAAGTLWLTTGFGLARFNPSTGKCITYDEGDGIQSLEFRRGAAHRGRSGVFHVGGTNGFNMFRPGEIITNSHIPPMAITSMRVLDREVNVLANPFSFSYDEDYFAFEFAALDFSEPRKNRYAYMLEGLESDWVETGTRRFVSYANLAPGDYIFTVKGSNNDGVWNEEGTSIAFTIAPPPWQTWWAYSIYGILIVMSVIGFRRYEITKIRNRERQEAALREAELRAELEKQKTRVQIARDLHDEVGSTLSSISFFAQAMGKKGEEKEGTNKFLSLISESSAHAREAMSDIIWSIDPANDSWSTVASKLQRYASELFESKGIAHSIEMPASELAVNIDPQRRRHFWLLFKEIVTNVAKHSQCSEVRIRLDVQNGSVVLTIADNGIGFDSNIAKDGHGLKNIRSRAELLGASAELKTSPGNGTSWKITFSV
jgi:ligand-binding sensor domain-containing protein/signal transduction histidine kinase